MSDITLPKAVEAFVATTNAHDAEALFAVFADTAVVHDDGNAYTTEEEIRSWIQVHQIGPKIVLTPTSFNDGRLVASVNGEFDGGPMNFAFDFTTEGDLVTDLAIGLA
ncbi:nuclear transport factor 2 family protein [Curtobacterium sp. ISL-83]|uniref:nuclear transport factor 2 family protein n=1 Tax=Curtobacterium sp. ISL-83 TaxID=2819145 RepID=UPI001BE645F8|nr:nuclear transport factor 2 family protein [Curtobacterium sp. ISL-83]MBT2502132.1 nuclear transport factor 2 family protein [Curtobacterium sp. ISL-83]